MSLADPLHLIGFIVIGVIVGVAWGWLTWCALSGGRPYTRRRDDA